ncbi:hypothetical protein [Flavobacterium sp.]|uniref:hypothetical protein n=1 Tax=Flavobacterium sp. TaxID=239 RepID=UPI001209B6A5|nr:hypothetical protein [Flavobacterium sp.]RZJ72814.1 MAG: hypothetical protein EOO49_04030 [Flavobacterium sp.]
MRFLIAIALFFSITVAFAQKPCDFSADVKDSLGVYKSTREYAFYERVFGGTSAHIFFSLVKTDETLALNVNFITKSNDFVKANCLDKNSRMYLQLANGKVVTLIYAGDENCGTSIRDQNNKNNRIQTAVFLFMKSTYEELRKSPIDLMRIRYGTETVDYIVKSSFVSEQDGKTYTPNTYFIDTLHCIFD